MERTWIGDPPYDRGPVLGVPKDDLDKLHARIAELEAALAKERLAGDELLTKYSQVEDRADRLSAMLKEAEEALRGTVESARYFYHGSDFNGEFAEELAILARLEAREHDKGDGQ
jgi:predicted  nucleic acid-binding Zn-ribbon protein